MATNDLMAEAYAEACDAIEKVLYPDCYVDGLGFHASKQSRALVDAVFDRLDLWALYQKRESMARANAARRAAKQVQA